MSAVIGNCNFEIFIGVNLFEIIEESLLKKAREFHFKIFGFDKSPSAVTKANKNAENAHLDEYISVRHEDFFKSGMCRRCLLLY